jgi:hypothetical protein
MKVLRSGANGDDVIKWQNFLRGRDPYSELYVSGVFDVDTIHATKQFQFDNGLDDDGIVGALTYAAALKVGFDIVDDENSYDDGPSWPPRPDFYPMSYADRVQIFGEFKYVSAGIVGNPEAIKITDGWGSKNIKMVTFPGPVGTVTRAEFNVKIADQVSGLFSAWAAAGLWPKLLTWDGSWAPRFIRGSRTVLSNHSWGTAFDVNYKWNQLGHTPALKHDSGSVRELVHIANEHGFFWGGHYKTRLDGMHFEIAKVLDK